ncbi:MAG: hypothetical protein AAGM38_11945 [Pseudomonadota bacterium]
MGDSSRGTAAAFPMRGFAPPPREVRDCGAFDAGVEDPFFADPRPMRFRRWSKRLAYSGRVDQIEGLRGSLEWKGCASRRRRRWCENTSGEQAIVYLLFFLQCGVRRVETEAALVAI